MKNIKNGKNSWLFGLFGSDVNMIICLLFLLNARKHVPAEEYSKYRAIWILSIGASLLSVVIFALFEKNIATFLCRVMVVFSSVGLFYIMLKIQNGSFLAQMSIAGPLNRRLLSMLCCLIFLLMSIYIFTAIKEESVGSIFKWYMAICFGFLISGRLTGLLWFVKKEV